MGKLSTVSINRNELRARLRTLLERFGSLLTEKQLTLTRQFAVENLSYSEIARRSNVSRQAVHEAIKNTEKLLTEYDNKLSHLPPSSLQEKPQGKNIGEIISRLESIKVKIAKTELSYSVDWIKREIDHVVNLLDHSPADPLQKSDGN